jgi:hypothetical protein
MQAKSIKSNSAEEVKKAFLEIVIAGFKPTLAFLFISQKEDWKSVVTLLDDHNVSVIGATTVGEFTEEGIDEGSVAMLLLDLDPAYFKIALRDHTDGSAIQSGREIGQEGLNTFSRPAFIITGSYIETPGELIMEGMLEVIDADTNVIGGMAGDDKRLSGNCVFTNDAESRQGALALILDEDKVSLAGEAVSGWKVVGTEKTITDCEGSWIHTIDHQPALDVVQKYTGIEINDVAGGDSYRHIGTTFPLQIIQKSGKPVMRPMLMYDTEKKSVMCGGKVEKGSRFKFSLPPDFEVVDEVVESSVEVKKNILPEADALIIFSCIGRFVSLGPMISDEIQGIRDTWNTPMAGFFCMGEFGKTKNGTTQFHGTTCSWVAMKEQK